MSVSTDVRERFIRETAPLPGRVEMGLVSHRWLTIYLVGAFLVSGLWASARIGGLALVTLIPLFLLIRRWRIEGTVETVSLGSLRSWNVVIGVGSLLVPAWFLTMTWNHDFPFVGDHDFHLIQSLEALEFWQPYTLLLLLILALLIHAGGRTQLTAYAIGATVLAVGAGFFLGEGPLFSIRYPGSFYFLALPLTALSNMLDWAAPLNALRLTNLASLPVWLFVLRPLVIKRWPDLALLPLVAFLFLQKEVVYYFSSAYIEPWAVIMVLLAVEHLVVFGGEGNGKSLILIGAASMIKEQAILVLPFFFVVTFPRGSWRVRFNHIFIATVAAAPFCLYYTLRQRSNVWRTVDFSQIGGAVTDERLRVFADRLFMQFGPTLYILGGILAWAIFLFIRGCDRRKAVQTTALLAAIFQTAFFFFDRASYEWTGYARFNLIALALFGSMLLYLGHEVASVVSISIVLVTVNLVTLSPFLARARDNEMNLNFFEHGDSPIYFPVSELVAAGGQRGLLTGVRAVRVVHNIGEIAPGYRLGAFRVAYPRVAERLEIILDSDTCRCTKDDEAVTALFVYFPPDNLAPIGKSTSTGAAADTCYLQLRESCRRAVEVLRDGQRVAVLGVGVRNSL